MSSYSRPPLWVTAVIIIAMLPIFQYPWLLSRLTDTDNTIRTLLWAYPIYVVLSGALAWVSYSTRPAVSWILIALMLLSHISMFLL